MMTPTHLDPRTQSRLRADARTPMGIRASIGFVVGAVVPNGILLKEGET